MGLIVLGAGTLGIAASSTLGNHRGTGPSPSVTTPDSHRPAPNAGIASFAPEATSVTLAVTGDLDPAGLADLADPRAALAPVRSYLGTADLARCRLSGPLPADVADRVAKAIGGAGFDTCSAGAAAGTLTALDRAGITADVPATDATPVTIETQTVRGAQVALLSYRDSPGLGAERIIRDAGRAHQDGADVVVIEMTWGDPGHVTPTARQRGLARQLLAAPDVDLIIGSGAGVVQPIERIGGRYVAYGLGTLLGGSRPDTGSDGLLVTVRLRRTALGWWVAGLDYTPTWADPDQPRAVPIADALDDPHTPGRTRSRLGASWQRTVSAVTDLGSSDGVRAERSPRDPTGGTSPTR